MKQQWPDGWFSERETENGAMLPLNDWEDNFLLVGGGLAPQFIYGKTLRPTARV